MRPFCCSLLGVWGEAVLPIVGLLEGFVGEAAVLLSFMDLTDRVGEALLLQNTSLPGSGSTQ